ncbi:MAG: hypothetical protein N3E37_01250 [Candidatus Micrarchaeota archaeon]|nr:hypothetical protein [Candidatus Micrarchaeota archaeon]
MEVAIAYSPCHISGLAVLYRDSSVGAGFCIEEGMMTKVSIKPTQNKVIAKFFYNNLPLESPATSLRVVKKYAQEYGKPFELTVNHYCSLPIGYGLGISGAAAISLSYALNYALNMNLSEKDVVRIAHNAEVEAKTGLSTVIGLSLGGLVIRPKHKFRDIQRKSVNDTIYILPVAPISTKQIISTDMWKSKVNMYGRKAMRIFLSEKSIDSLIQASRYMAIETGLAELNSFFYKYITSNKDCGMAMFGFTLFSNKPIGHPRVIKTRVTDKKAQLL